ncbi:hypothetical protein OXIME_000430 [Oxyplasma meridianum]|uniref:Uncharacterized protein n=1 Tax=Oxyplasma meridianum TaxID=3073602 RepID=A0AAX4NGL5_9ARCH
MAIVIEVYSFIITAFLINLPHRFYGPHIQHQRPFPVFKNILSLSFLLTDEINAILVFHPDLEKRRMQ